MADPLDEFGDAGDSSPGELVVVGEFASGYDAEAAAKVLDDAGFEPRVIPMPDPRLQPVTLGGVSRADVVMVPSAYAEAAAQLLSDFDSQELPDAFNTPEVLGWAGRMEEVERRRKERRRGNAWRFQLILGLIALALVAGGLVGALSAAN